MADTGVQGTNVHVIDSVSQVTDLVPHHVHRAAFPPFDTQHFASHIFWLALSFALFYFLISWVILPRIGSILELRRNLIRDDLAKAEESKKTADAMIEHYEKLLKETREKSKSIVDAAIKAAKLEAQEQRQQLEDSLRKQLSASNNALAEAKAKASSNLSGAVFDVTQAMLANLVGDKMNDGLVKEAIDQAQGAGRHI